MITSPKSPAASGRHFIMALLVAGLAPILPASGKLDKAELLKTIQAKKSEQSKKESSADPCKDYPTLKICTLRKEIPTKKSK